MTIENAESSATQTITPANPTPVPMRLSLTVINLMDPTLALSADVLNDAEDNRKANASRLRHLTATEPDEDGAVRGLGLDETSPVVARLAALVDALIKIEKDATTNLEKVMRLHPLGPWCKAQKGVGDKQFARLLATIGDPYLITSMDDQGNLTFEPRTVSQLWSYAGHGDATRRRFKGMSQGDLFAMGNPTTKMRLWNIAGACLKAQGPYADIYYKRREATENRLHGSNCVRCGPSGKPALEGSPWSKAHQHADALRIVGKEILRDLWIESKRIHELAADGVIEKGWELYLL